MRDLINFISSFSPWNFSAIFQLRYSFENVSIFSINIVYHDNVDRWYKKNDKSLAFLLLTALSGISDWIDLRSSRYNEIMYRYQGGDDHKLSLVMKKSISNSNRSLCDVVSRLDLNYLQILFPMSFPRSVSSSICAFQTIYQKSTLLCLLLYFLHHFEV